METVNEILSALGVGESGVMWALFVIAAVRGIFATAAEWIPNSKLGGAAGLVDLLGGNNRNASGSQ